MDDEHVNVSINIEDNKDSEHVNIIEDDDMGEVEKDDVVDLEQTECGSNKLKRRKPSIVWEHFNKPNSIGGRTTCKHCKKTYVYEPSKNGTSTLLTHLKRLCKFNPLKCQEDKKQKTLNFQGKGEGGKLGCGRFTKELGKQAIAIMIIIDELPFRFVEKEGFRYLCSVIRPEMELPSRITIAREILSLYVDEKKQLKDVLHNSSQAVCLTTDVWTSCQNINYMVLTVHYIDGDWNLQKRILNFEVISNHKGDTIGKMIESCLITWGIEKVFTITVDNASSNDTAISFLKKKIKNWGNAILDGRYLHMRCCAHVLNLIVCEGLKDYDPAIQVIRNAVRYVRSSPARLATFKECLKIEKLDVSGTVCLDVSTRWNSTYLMLEAALKYRKAFNRLEEDGQYARFFNVGPSSLLDLDGDAKKKHDITKIGPPSDIDWDIADSFMTFLKVFYDVTNRFSGSLYVTSSGYFHDMCLMQTHIDECIEKGDERLSHMAINMRLKYEKYWGNVEKMNPLLYVAVVLDPRYKLSYVNWSLDDLYPAGSLASNLKKRIKATLSELYDFYCAKDPKHSKNNSSKKSNNLDGISEGLSIQERRMQKYKSHLEAGSTVELSELDRYLKDDKEPMYESFDLLHWWKVNGEKYKILAKLARDVLAVPVSTVASESAFSTGGRILDPFRSSLSPKTVQALVCTQNWIRARFRKETSVEYKDMLNEIEELEDIENDFASNLNICTDHIN